jgi:hypothetical protein
VSSTSFLGIDWGTHSSKSAWYRSNLNRYDPHLPIFPSDLRKIDETIIFAAERETHAQDLIRSIKGVLIMDPLGTPFWSNESRGDTGTSLGEAVAFSLTALLNDAISSSSSDEDFEIGFSFPNWLAADDRKAQAAAQNFREAVAVAAEVVAQYSFDELPQPTKPFSISRWREIVSTSRPRIDAGRQFDLQTIMSVRNVTSNGRLRWGFISESGAAGLPYLRAMEIEDVPGAHGLAKLLVVDVGAGSTDIGYMLRVQHRETNKANLYYFAPASSLPVAGNVLTRELLNFLRAKNQRITEIEAELRKMQETGWHELAFVQNWISQIAQHVREYVEGIPDERWLPLPVTLNVVVTGGSGLVPGLKKAVTDAVRQGLQSRIKEKKVLEKIQTPGEHLPKLSFGTEPEYARRAVCLGASDADRPSCKFMSNMEAPGPQFKIAGAPKWT